MKLLRALLLMLAAVTAVAGPVKAATTQLPPGEQCFTIGGGQPAVNGSMNMYVPGGTVPKATYKTADQTVANTNPIALDADGCAIIYGVGTYRQQLFDGPVVGGIATGNLIFDLPTTDTSAYNSTFWGGLSGGSPNVITVVDVGFNATDGTIINFLALSTNTGSTTLNPSGFGAINIEKATTGGLTSLTGGEIVAGNPISVIYSSSNNAFILLNTAIASASGSATPLCGATGFKSQVTTNTAISLSAGALVTTSTTGQVIFRSNVAVTLNASTVGANGLSTDISGGTLAVSTWYYEWMIDNGSAAASLLSASSTSPVLPSGYTTQCRLGAVVTDGSGNLERVLQRGHHAQYIVGTNPALAVQIAIGITGTYSTTSPTLANVTVSGVTVPTTATAITVSAAIDAGNLGLSGILVAPNTAYGGTNNGPVGTNVNTFPIWIDPKSSETATNPQATMTLESTTISWASNGAGGAIFALGWDDAINGN